MVVVPPVTSLQSWRGRGRAEGRYSTCPAQPGRTCPAHTPSRWSGRPRRRPRQHPARTQTGRGGFQPPPWPAPDPSWQAPAEHHDAPGPAASSACRANQVAPPTSTPSGTNLPGSSGNPGSLPPGDPRPRAATCRTAARSMGSASRPWPRTPLKPARRPLSTVFMHVTFAKRLPLRRGVSPVRSTWRAPADGRRLARRTPRLTVTGACAVPAPAGGHRSPQRICPRRARPIPADCRPGGSASLSLRAAAHRGRATAHHRR